MTRALLFISVMIISACRHHDLSEGIEVSNRELESDCAFWMERDAPGSALRGGIAGACSQMTSDTYARELDLALAKAVSSGIDVKKVRWLYLNSYESDGITSELMNLANASGSWTNDCLSAVDLCLSRLRREASYFRGVDNVVAKHIGPAYEVSFKGVTCLSRDVVARLYDTRKFPKNCYPSSFGVAVFAFQKT